MTASWLALRAQPKHYEAQATTKLPYEALPYEALPYEAMTASWFALGTKSKLISPCLRQPSYSSHVFGRYVTSGSYSLRYGMYTSSCSRSFQPSKCTPVEYGSTRHVRANEC